MIDYDYDYQDIQEFCEFLEQGTFPDPETLCIMNDIFVQMDKNIREKLLHGKRTPWSRKVKEVKNEMQGVVK